MATFSVVGISPARLSITGEGEEIVGEREAERCIASRSGDDVKGEPCDAGWGVVEMQAGTRPWVSVVKAGGFTRP